MPAVVVVFNHLITFHDPDTHPLHLLRGHLSLPELCRSFCLQVGGDARPPTPWSFVSAIHDSSSHIIFMAFNNFHHSQHQVSCFLSFSVVSIMFILILFHNVSLFSLFIIIIIVLSLSFFLFIFHHVSTLFIICITFFLFIISHHV